MGDTAIPDGFVRHFRQSGLTDPWEPIYSKILDNAVQIGLVLDEPHCNSRGLAHGGLIAALSDNSMGLSCAVVAAAAGAQTGTAGVTLSLTTDYVGIARMGQWLQFSPEVTKAGRSVCFARCRVEADGAVVATASATFKIG